jgi:hypothetical protein
MMVLWVSLKYLEIFYIINRLISKLKQIKPLKSSKELILDKAGLHAMRLLL